MSKAASLTQADEALYQPGRAPRPAGKPFAGLIDAVIVDDPVMYPFEGSVARSDAQAVWTWLMRDVCPGLISMEAAESGSLTADDLEPLMTEALARMRETVALAETDYDAGRRLRAQIGGDEHAERLPVVLNALRCRALLGRAQAFGKATNTISDDAGLITALQSMPIQDAPVAALLFHAAIGQVANPTMLVTAITKLAGSAKEDAIARSGYGPLVDAILAHAQNQLHLLQPMGAFADIDLTCRGLERFHRLVRALSGYIEFSRNSRWTMVLAAITKQVSERIEPRLRDLVPDMNQSLRKGRDGADRLDNDRLLSALNGIYLLAAIRDSRESLALNALFDQTWSQAGQALEMHLERNLELLRQNPDDKIVGLRLDAGIKMAEVRFNAEYADTLTRARHAAERRG
jgi:hypothetical protein